MLPSVAPPPQKLVTTTTTSIPIDSSDHHDGHEVSPMEVQEYIKDHPDTWVPPGYGKDRSDWFPAGTYNPYVNKWRKSYPNSQPYQRTSWKPSSANIHRYIPRMKRSSNSGDQFKQEFEQEEDRFNISHHRDWEHFYHYRERRELYHMLETGLGNNDHHDGHEVSPMEVQEYIKDHPDTWVPPGYGKDRSDWFPAGTYNPYVNKWRQSYPNSQPYQRTSWKPSSANIHRYIPRMKRSSNSGDQLKQEFEQEEDRFNISHHRDWEHFYHYRERRELYHMLETGLGNKFDIVLRSCIMRAICEVRSFLQPPGRSMIMDLVRILFSVPLKANLNDEYSNAMRSERLDCHELYGKQCPISFLYLLLFGKFVP
ncbi:conserved hypothetical protein [Culex quinquefasciatus]|uniref:Uncharacterized protein n=1 Tax=Culex quinquefasciatus TaxID=7176 RepID=B0X5Q9_CULQU|nr:conserved hypothetical protein [Culex quinquefasciatus]|eukprot:XP_001864981.1 conserved hypothetical protein [Culex quinquefasciatus]